MRSSKIAFEILIFLLSSVYCGAEIRYDFGVDVKDLNIYIVKSGEEIPPEEKPFTEVRQTRYYGKHVDDGESVVFSGLDAGEYTLLVGFLSSSFYHEFIFYERFKYDGETYLATVKLPSGKMSLSLNLEAFEIPRLLSGSSVSIAKLERFKEGEIDPIFKRWIHFNSAKELSAEVPFVESGKYRISFFDTVDDAQGMFKDHHMFTFTLADGAEWNVKIEASLKINSRLSHEKEAKNGAKK